MTQTYLKRKFDYDVDTGVFTFKVFAGSKRPGDTAGCVTSKGYRHITIDKKAYKAHRLAWLYVYGKFPDNDIDHIDHNKDNNAIYNLREVSCIENSKNRPLDKRNKSGVTGVYYIESSGNWRSRIRVNKQTINLGTYDNIDDAKTARIDAEILYGFHDNHGDNL